MAASDIRAGRAFVEVTAKDNLTQSLARAQAKLRAFAAGVSAIGSTLQKFGRGFADAAGKVEAFGTKVFGVGALALAGFGVATKAYADAGDALAKMSTRTGVSVEALSGLAYAAKQSGTDAEGMEKAMQRMSRTIVDAKRGTQQAVEALGLLGLTVNDLAALSPDEQFLLIGDRLSRVENPTKKAAAAMQVFGRAGAELIPMFADGAKGVRELMTQAQRLGLVMSTQDAKAAEEFGDRVGDLWEVMKMGSFILGSAVAKELRGWVVTATNAAVAANRWVREHAGLVTTALKVAAGVAVAGAAFVALGAAGVAAGMAIEGIGTLLAVAGGALSAVVSAIGLVVSPIGLMVGGLAAAGAAFVYFSNTGNMAVDALKGAFGKVLDSIGAVMGTTGDLSSAWAAAMQEIGFTARQAWEDVKVIWAQMKAFGGQVFDEMGDLFVKAWIRATSEVAKVMAKGAALTKHIWAQSADAFVQGPLIDRINELTGRVNRIKDLQSKGQATKEELDYLPKAEAELKTKQGELAYSRTVNPQDNIIDDTLRARLDALEKQKQQDLAIVDQSRGDHAGERQDAVDAAKAEAARNKAAIEGERVDARVNRALDLFESGGTSLRDRIAHIFGPDSPMLDLAKFRAPNFDLGDVAARTVSVAGQFGGLGADQLGGGVQERIAKATEETAKGVKRLLTAPNRAKFS